MASYPRPNSIDQNEQIAGSASQSDTLTVTDERSGYGPALSGQAGAAASTASGAGANQLRLTGLTGMTANSVGNFLTVSGAATGANNGTFRITVYNSATSVDVLNPSGVTPDANDAAISWTERYPYSLNNDMDFRRTWERLMKGTTNWDDTVPTYIRPTATGTSVPANLANIAGKTTDAQTLFYPKASLAVSVAATNTKVTLTSAGNFKHATSLDLTGFPVFDTGPFAADWGACYVVVTSGIENEMKVKAGLHAGERIFGVLYNGASTSPNSIEVRFYSVAEGGNMSTGSTAYTWEAGQPTTLELAYKYNERIDQLPRDAFTTVQALGVVSDADVRQDINDIQALIGSADGDTNLATELTNTGNYYPFVNLPDATPSIVEALNTLNAQIGARSYSAPGTTYVSGLTSGQTISASIQALANAIAASGVTRVIERLAADISPNTSHLLPGGLTYVLDGGNNGAGLMVFVNRLLQDPGSVLNGDDYAETDATHVTNYYRWKKDWHINYVRV